MKPLRAPRRAPGNLKCPVVVPMVRLASLLPATSLEERMWVREERPAVHDDCGSPYDLNHIYVLGSHFLHCCGANIGNVLVRWRCSEGHLWRATVACRIASDDAGCPTCWSRTVVAAS